jgi:hypothetical protein
MVPARTVLLRSANSGRSPDGTGLDRSKQIGTLGMPCCCLSAPHNFMEEATSIVCFFLRRARLARLRRCLGRGQLLRFSSLGSARRGALEPKRSGSVGGSYG